jgi:hypothetical protein
MKTIFISIFSFFFAQVFFGKKDSDFFNLSNFKIDITQEDIDSDLLYNQS